MFDGLDSINWNELTHAYGKAGDVPGLLRKLASSDLEDQEKALYELYGNIWHQGTVYEATAYAVPFLIRLATEQSVKERHAILGYLAELANGTSYHDVHQHLELLKAKAETAEWRAEIRKELDWVRATREAVKTGIPEYLKLLSDPEPHVRSHAAYLLENFIQEDEQIRTALVKRLESEVEKTCRAAFILAISRDLPVNEQETYAKRFLEHMKQEKEPAVRLAAAMAVARLEQESGALEAINVLSDAIAWPEKFEELRVLPIFEESLEGTLSSFLALIASRNPDAVLSVFLKMLQGAEAYSALQLTESALAVAFGRTRVDPKTRFAELQPNQQRVLRTLLAVDKAWHLKVNMADVLKPWGLPTGRDKMRAFVEENKTAEECETKLLARPNSKSRGFFSRWFKR